MNQKISIMRILVLVNGKRCVYMNNNLGILK
jgi:hypothetical protein